MAANYVVLIQREETDWIPHEVEGASSPAAAIEQLRDADPDLKMDRGARFLPMTAGKFKPKRMRRRLMTTWELADADLPDDEPEQGQLDT